MDAPEAHRKSVWIKAEAKAILLAGQWSKVRLAIDGGGASKLYSKATGRAIQRGGPAIVVEKRDEMLEMLGDYRTFVVLGARDESLADLAKAIAERLKK